MTQHLPAGGRAARCRKDTLNLAGWTGAWLVSLAIATFGPLLVWNGTVPLTLAAILVNLGVGVGMILANKRHLQGLDELHQKIQLEAMALTLGIALIVGLAYSLLDVTDVVPFDAEISHLVTLMGVTYGIAIAMGRRRYQ
jgi:hypothetical protein